MKSDSIEEILNGSHLRKHFSKQEKKMIYKAWETSGLAKNVFCKKHNLSKSSFYNWTHSTRQKFKTFCHKYVPLAASV